jgi:hypothetical protein
MKTIELAKTGESIAMRGRMISVTENGFVVDEVDGKATQGEKNADILEFYEYAIDELNCVQKHIACLKRELQKRCDSINGY